MGSPSGHGSSHHYSFKILLIGDSGVGKSSLLVSFISNHVDDLAPTIGSFRWTDIIGGDFVAIWPCVLCFEATVRMSSMKMTVLISEILSVGEQGLEHEHGERKDPLEGVDFKIKHLTVGGKKLKLTIWDTAGQEKFRTLTSSYFRNAQGIILVYDVTQRETFTNLSEVWAKEVELYSTNQDCIKVLVGNKVDKDKERMVTKEEGAAFAQECGCVFLECSAKTRANVEKCFEELAQKILEVPSLLEEGSAVGKKNILRQKQEGHVSAAGGCCS